MNIWLFCHLVNYVLSARVMFSSLFCLLRVAQDLHNSTPDLHRFFHGLEKAQLEHPVRTNQVLRQFPVQAMFTWPVMGMLIGGTLLLGCCTFVQLFCISNSIWYVLLLFSAQRFTRCLIYLQFVAFQRTDGKGFRLLFRRKVLPQCYSAFKKETTISFVNWPFIFFFLGGGGVKFLCFACRRASDAVWVRPAFCGRLAEQHLWRYGCHNVFVCVSLLSS